jgi:NAD(P)-dependent dehydrogenase (short-subunit alcohol dehydrogenase family)
LKVETIPTYNMTTLSAIRAANAAFSPSYLPVALFVGGTSGIGHATAEAFARYTKGDAHIIICGRNRAAADSIIAAFPKTTKSRYEFVECDATLMKNVQATTTSLLSSLPKLNYLFITTGYLTLKGRDETSEGIDKKLALNYYARWKFIYDLMPLLRKAKDAGEDAKAMSVLAAGKGGPIDLDDLGLKKGFSLSAAGVAAATYNDLMIEVRSFVRAGFT